VKLKSKVEFDLERAVILCYELDKKQASQLEKNVDIGTKVN
jgi:hypothetical protein